MGYVTNNYVSHATARRSHPVNKWSIKGDHIFNEKHRISGYYGYDRENLSPRPDGPATLPGPVHELQRSDAGTATSSA